MIVLVIASSDWERIQSSPLPNLEWINYFNTELLKISLIASCDYEAVNASGGGDHSILQELIGLLIPQPPPLPKTTRIHGKNLPGLSQ